MAFLSSSCRSASDLATCGMNVEVTSQVMLRKKISIGSLGLWISKLSDAEA